MKHQFHPTVVREYDIRGIIGETLGADDARDWPGFRHLAARRGRLHRGGGLCTAGSARRCSNTRWFEGLTASGCDVVRIGMGATPMLYYAEASDEEVDGGIQITGSHNPPELQWLQDGVSGASVLRRRYPEARGTGSRRRIRQRHGQRHHARHPWRVCRAPARRPRRDRSRQARRAAASAGMPGMRRRARLEALAARLPGEHHLLFTEVDGHFPNHHPDPTVEANLADLRALVADKNLDFGVAFDGDGDRIGAIDGTGRVIWGDQLLMIYAEDLLKNRPHSTIIADVKASRALFDRVAELGGEPLMWKTGHSLIKSKMKETGAPLAGEMSGHVFFADEYYGFDDALYAGYGCSRLRPGSANRYRAARAIPPMLNTPELRFQVDEVRKFAAMAEIAGRLITNPGPEVESVNATSGVRVNTADGWWLVRASNTQDVLVARAESETPEGLERLLAQIDAQLAASGLERGKSVGH
uniref:Phosphomannomutase n=1 Tax=Prochlorothrix hollandica TaxID=1223 RepID=Q51847_PROHO|nr:phosphomannomutase [Prochlorothrix hollandica]